MGVKILFGGLDLPLPTNPPDQPHPQDYTSKHCTEDQPSSHQIFVPDGSPEPFTFDVMSVEPFPILVQNGAMLSIAIQITLNEEVPVGTQVALNMVLEGIIPIKIPCLDIDGLTIGSW